MIIAIDNSTAINYFVYSWTTPVLFTVKKDKNLHN